MAKKKEKTGNDGKIVVGDGNKKIIKKKDEILDTSAPDLILDLTAVDEEKTIEGILNLGETRGTRKNMTVSFRINEDDLEWAKKVTRNLSIKGDKDINYQKLIISTFLEKFTRPENFNKKNK